MCRAVSHNFQKVWEEGGHFVCGGGNGKKRVEEKLILFCAKFYRHRRGWRHGNAATRGTIKHITKMISEDDDDDGGHEPS